MAQPVRPPQFRADRLLAPSTTGDVGRSLRDRPLNEGVECTKQHARRHSHGELERCAPTTHGPADKAGVLQRGDRRSHHHAPVSPRAYAPVAPHLLRGAEAPHGCRGAVTPDEELAEVSIGVRHMRPVPGAANGLSQSAGRNAQRPGELRQLVDDGPPEA